MKIGPTAPSNSKFVPQSARLKSSPAHTRPACRPHHRLSRVEGRLISTCHLHLHQVSSSLRLPCFTIDIIEYACLPIPLEDAQ